MIDSVPRPGDIMLARMPGWHGRLIRVGQWFNGDGFSDWEHAGIVTDTGTVVQAQPGGAEEVPLDPEGKLFVCPDGIDDATRMLVVEHARMMLGTPYSWVDYAAIGAHRLRLPIPFLRYYVGCSKHMICSQLCDMAFRMAGWDLFPGEWPGYCTPGSIGKKYGRA